MGVLRIRLFGTVHVAHDGRGHEARLIHAVQTLLAYLTLHRRKTHAREVLAGLFWGEHTEARARSCLSTALWRLRQVLEPEGVPRGTYLLTRGSGEVGFNCDSDHWLDVAAFEGGMQALARLKPDQLVAEWDVAERAIGQYGGDLLEGFYEEWALRERERLRMLYLDGLGRLFRTCVAAAAGEQALACGRRILELDPLREDIHREIIRLHLRSGHRALALQQYEVCRSVLAQELGIEPMEETRALHQQVAPGVIAVRRRTPAVPARQALLPPLHAAARTLDEARDQLSRAIRLAESDDDHPAR